MYVLDEDCRDHDDRLGHVTIDFADLAEWGEGKVDETWYKLRKKGASKKAAVLRLCAAGMNVGEGRTARVLVRIEVKGETKLEKEKDVGRAFTRGPSMSPLQLLRPILSCQYLLFSHGEAVLNTLPPPQTAGLSTTPP